MAQVLTVYARCKPVLHLYANRSRARTTFPSSQAALMESEYDQLYHSSEIFDTGDLPLALNSDNNNRAQKQSRFFRMARWEALGECLTVLQQQCAPVA